MSNKNYWIIGYPIMDKVRHTDINEARDAVARYIHQRKYIYKSKKIHAAAYNRLHGMIHLIEVPQASQEDRDLIENGIMPVIGMTGDARDGAPPLPETEIEK